MAGSISTYIVNPGFSLSAGATANVDMRITDINDLKVFMTQTWLNGTAAGGTGIGVNLYPGWGGKDPAENPNTPIPYVLNGSTVPQFANNFAAVTTQSGGTAIIQPATGQAASAMPSTTTAFYLNNMFIIWPDWVRMQIYSLDATKVATITINASI